MPLPAEAELLRVFIGETDKHQGRPLYEVIVEAAKQHGLAGASVLRATMGFGSHNQIHSAKVLRLSEDLPMIVEIVDTPDRLAAFVPVLDQLLNKGLVTLEKIRILIDRPSANVERQPGHES